jgi:hypothetical protein
MLSTNLLLGVRGLDDLLHGILGNAQLPLRLGHADVHVLLHPPLAFVHLHFTLRRIRCRLAFGRLRIEEERSGN